MIMVNNTWLISSMDYNSLPPVPRGIPLKCISGVYSSTPPPSVIQLKQELLCKCKLLFIILLFIIFINDLPDVAISDIFTSLYADDTKVYRNINTIEDCMSMQKTLTNMDTWTRHNNIRSSASKCKALTITRKKSPLNFIYKLDSVELECVSTEKDVGVNITNPLNWNTHMHAITAKANKILGRLKCTCPLLNDVSTRCSLYLALVK